MVRPRNNAFSPGLVAARLVRCVPVLALLAGCAGIPEDVRRIKPALRQTNDARALVPAPDVSSTPGLSPLVSATLSTRPAIRAAAEEVEAAISGIGEARSAYYPQVSARARTRLAGGGNAGLRPELVGSQLLYDFGRTGRAVSREALETRRAHLEFIGVVEENLAETARIHAEFIGFDAQLAVARARLAAMTEIRDRIGARTQEGVGDTTELLEAGRRVRSAETILLRAELDRRSALRRLADQSGLGGGAPEALGGRPLLCAGPLDAEALPEVQIAAVDVASAELGLADARRGRYPSVALEASASPDLTGAGRGDTGIGVNLTLDSDVFQGGAARARIEGASRKVGALTGTGRAALEAARSDYDDAITEIEDHRLIIASLEEQTGVLDETRALYRTQYTELGSRSLSDLLDVEEDYYQTLLDLAATRMDLEIAQVDCLETAGRMRQTFGLAGRSLYGLTLGP